MDVRSVGLPGERPRPHPQEYRHERHQYREPVMMGRAHALSGVALCLALTAAALLTAVYSVPTSMALFLAPSRGPPAVLPDIDPPDATVSQVFGPATWILSKVVNAVSGGHRNGTHSALGCALPALSAVRATALHTGNPDTAMQGLLCGGVLLVTTLPVLFLVGPTDQRCYKSEWGRSEEHTSEL